MLSCGAYGKGTPTFRLPFWWFLPSVLDEMRIHLREGSASPHRVPGAPPSRVSDIGAVMCPCSGSGEMRSRALMLWRRKELVAPTHLALVKDAITEATKTQSTWLVKNSDNNLNLYRDFYLLFCFLKRFYLLREREHE